MFNKGFVKMINILILCGLVLLNPMMTQAAKRASVTLAWDKNPEPEVIGYTIYYGVASKAYTKSIETQNVSTYKISNLNTKPTYYFAIKARDNAGRLSDFSDEVSFKYIKPKKKKKKSLWDKVVGFFSAPQPEPEPEMQEVKGAMLASSPLERSNQTSSKSPQKIEDNRSSLVLTWEPKEKVSHYIVHWGTSSKVFQSNQQVKDNNLLRVPKPSSKSGPSYYMIEAVDALGHSHFSDEVMIKHDTAALMTKLPWKQTGFRSGTPQVNRDEGNIKVLISNDTNNQAPVTSPDVLCSFNGMDWQILVNDLDFDVGEISRELIIPFPKGIVPPNFYIRVEGEPENAEG